MGRAAQLRLTTLRTCLVNLPLSIHGPLLERGVIPQSLVVELSYTPTQSTATPTAKNGKELRKAYVGWSGLPSAVSSLTGQVVRTGKAELETVEMDHQFAAMLGAGLAEGTPVSIELLRDLPTATSVSVTPVSADDWEILETNAEFVEMNLLSQVRAVREGMIIGCWIGGTTLVKFTVDATVPAASPALLLSSATELLVAPKTRQIPSSSSNKTHDISKSVASFSVSHPSEWESIRRRLVRLLPLPYVVEEKSVGEESSTKQDEVVLVSPPLFRQLTRVLSGLRCTLLHHARPVNRAPAGSEREKEKEGPSNGASEKEEKRIAVEVRIVEGRNVASGHIWIGEKLRKDLGLDLNSSFDLIKFGPPLSVAAKRTKENQKENEISPAPPTSNGTAHQTLARPGQLSRTNRSLSTVNWKDSASISAPPTIALAGVEDKISSIRSHVVNALASKQLSSSRIAASGILITGASGSGKTSLIRQVSKQLELDPQTLTHTMFIDCSKLSDERLPVLKGKMKDWFDEACWHAPSLVVFDNLDRMLGAEVEHADSFPALQLAHAFLAAASPALASRPIVLVATAQSSASLHPLLSTTHLLGENVSLRGPTKTGRRDIVSSLVKAKATSSNLREKNLDFASIAAQTEGYLPADLRDLVDRSIHQAAMRSSPDSIGLDLTLEDFTAAQIGFVPLSLRDVKLQKSEVQWADIGGLHETRRVLRETLEWPTKYGAIFANCPLRLRSGLLLYGFPGCGKTLLASAVAKECGLNFISVKGPEILNKYIGASEKSVRDLFERAQAAKPCILFFDEFDSIAPKRGHDSTGVTDRVVNQMLTQMDGAEGLDGVYVLAATSRPDLIDPALLRPGRLDKSLLCDMPSHSDRLEIMQACSRKIALSPEVDLSDYADETAGFSGADLQALIYNAHLDAIHATLTATTSAADMETSGGAEEMREIPYTAFGGVEKEEKVLSRAEQASVTKRLDLILLAMAAQSGNGKSSAVVKTPTNRPVTLVTNAHLQKSLKSTRPSVPAEELVRLTKIYTEFVSGRSATGLPSGEASGEVGARSSLM